MTRTALAPCIGRSRLYYPHMNYRAYVAEFIGTFTLVFVGVSTIAVTGGSNLVAIALAHGLAIAVMVSATAATSGGHLNPAVTIGALVAGKIKPVDAVGYVVAQCLGAIVASLKVKIAVPAAMLATVNMGIPSPGEGITTLQVLAMETTLTFFLVFVVFGTGIDARAPKVGGLFIGLTVALDILAGGAISGAAMNPARHLGPALLGGGTGNVWIYWVGPVTGGVAAALVYHHLIEDRSS